MAALDVSIGKAQTLLNLAGGIQGTDGDIYEAICHPSLKEGTLEVIGVEATYRGTIESINGDNAMISVISRDGKEYIGEISASLLAEHGLRDEEDAFALVIWQTPAGPELRFHRVEVEITDKARHLRHMQDRISHWTRVLESPETEVVDEV